MIKIENLCFSYGEKQIFRDFSLDIPDNGKVCFFGESGFGKTTLLRLIAGLETPQSGKIVLPENARFSAVFQEDRLLPFMSIADNCILVGSDRRTAERHLEALGIADAADSRPAALSGGMRRRAAIARALCAEFDILLLDEPFTGLDAENIFRAAEYISSLTADKTLLAVTHSPAEARLLGAKEIILDGRAAR